MQTKLRPLPARIPLALDSAQWRALLPRLVSHARRRLRGGCPERARELAQEAAVNGWLSGRAAPVAGDVEPVRRALCSVVNGLAANERRLRRRFCEVPAEDGELASFAGGASPEEVLIAAQERAHAVGRLRACLAGDDVALRLADLDLVEEGVEDAAARASAPQLPLTAIRNGRKRLLRALRGMVREADAG
jgi:hypothetical protein